MIIMFYKKTFNHDIINTPLSYKDKIKHCLKNGKLNIMFIG